MIVELAAALAVSACTAAETRATFNSFVKAYNAGDAATLDTLFAPEPAFQWYSSNPPGVRNRAAAFDRATLLTYFARRHARGDRLRVLSFRFNGEGTELGHFSFTLQRRARDYNSGRPFRIPGKGALSCALTPPAFVVISLGGVRRR